jgi:outer membrane protein
VRHVQITIALAAVVFAGSKAPAAESLADAWRSALAADQRLAASQAAVFAAECRTQAASAERWPRLSVESGYLVRDNEAAFVFSGPANLGPLGPFPYSQRESFVAGARANLPLYTSGRIENQCLAADARTQAERAAAQRTELTVKMAVAEAYVEVLRARDGLAVASQSHQNMVAHERDVTQRYRHQFVPQTDLLAAQVARAQARQREIQAHSQFEQAQAAYNRRLGRPLDAAVALADLPPAVVDDAIETLVNRALDRRPELAMLSAAAEALYRQAESTRSSHLPQLDLHGAYAFAENRFQQPEGIATGGLLLSCNLFDAGRTRFTVAADQYEAERTHRLIDDQRWQIRLEVRQAWLAAQEARRRLDVTREAVVHAEENLRVARLRYGQGAGTNTEVLDAETRRAETTRDHRFAIYDGVISALRVQFATGELPLPEPAPGPILTPVARTSIRRLPPVHAGTGHSATPPLPVLR